LFNPGIEDGDFLPARRAAGDPPLDDFWGPQPIRSPGTTFLLATHGNFRAVERVLKADDRSTKRSFFFGEEFWRIPNELCEQVKQEVLSEQQPPGHSGRYTG
jgi:hypothetical protein